MTDPVGQAIHGVFSNLDELMALASQEETKGQVCAEKIALGQMLSRCQLLVSFALTAYPPMKVVSNVG